MGETLQGMIFPLLLVINKGCHIRHSKNFSLFLLLNVNILIINYLPENYYKNGISICTYMHII